jgi:PilZ domain
LKNFAAFTNFSPVRFKPLAMDNDFPISAPIAGVPVETKAQERQRESIFLGAQVTFDGASVPVSVRVRNISSGGMMIDSTAKHAKGKTVAATIKGIGDVTGRVAWATDTRIGIAFDEPVDPKQGRQSIKKDEPEHPTYNKAYVYDRRPGLAIR